MEEIISRSLGLHVAVVAGLATVESSDVLVEIRVVVEFVPVVVINFSGCSLRLYNRKEGGPEKWWRKHKEKRRGKDTEKKRRRGVGGRLYREEEWEEIGRRNAQRKEEEK